MASPFLYDLGFDSDNFVLNYSFFSLVVIIVIFITFFILTVAFVSSRCIGRLL